MRWNVKKVVFFILGVYFLISCYTGYKLVQNRIWKNSYELQRIHALIELKADDPDWNPWGEKFEKEGVDPPKHNPPKILWNLQDVKSKETGKSSSDKTTKHHVVEVWGKAAIGFYLWEHILEGPLQKRLGGVWSYGAKTLDNVEFRFRTGPGVKPSKVPKETEHLILVLNGRTSDKIEFSKRWLDILPNFTNLKSTGLVLLGDETCNNKWLQPYLAKNGGPIKFVFLVYDSPEIDNDVFYQWPLGVATYRNFPKVDIANITFDSVRPYSCNFLGTIYRNSSRETLLHALEKGTFQKRCLIKARYTWLPHETDSSRKEYLHALMNSDLTLNPIGQNTECYRIYEAMSYGSLPVIEDVMTPGYCGKSPLRLLKENKAPVIYVKHWDDINTLLSKEMTLTQEDKARRRREISMWYESFKSKMRNRFLEIVQKHFFPLSYR